MVKVEPHVLVVLSPRVRTLLLVPLVVLPLLMGGPAEAAIGSAASNQEAELYFRIAAANFCYARAADVDFEKAAAIAVETISQLILGMHKGEIQQVSSKPLTLEQLRNLLLVNTLLGGSKLCPQAIPAEEAQKLKTILQQQAGTAGSLGPATAAPPARTIPPTAPTPPAATKTP